MLTDLEFMDWCGRLKLPEKGIKLVQAVRSAERLSRGEGSNRATEGRYSSRKMGRNIAYAASYISIETVLENNSDVLEYYAQPVPIYLDYQTRSGRRVYHPHMPDFFVIRRNGGGWEEFKREAELLRSLKKSPERWQQDGNYWRCRLPKNM